ncbi:ABC transporter permease [Streptococcus fryi]
MFGKLLKYEIKAAGKWYFLLYAGALILSIIIGFTINSTLKHSAENEMLYVQDTFYFFLTMTLVAIIVGISISTLFLIISRFNTNIFGREGYLTLTLPVSTHAVILSKLLTSVFWSLLNSLVLVLSFVLISLPSFALKDVLIILPRLKPYLMTPQAGLFILFALTSVLSAIMLIYFSISIGQLFQDRRGLMGFVAYFTIIVIWSVFDLAIGYNMEFFTPDFVMDTYLISGIIESSISAIIFYIGTYLIIKNKLNIQ